MPIFTKESLENLRQRIDLVDVLSSHLDLKRTGASYKALCPFHDERTPSFMLQKGDKHYHCFGCGAHGDAVSFLTTHLKLNFSEAIENLAQRYHIHLETTEGSAENKGPQKALLKEALIQAARFYHFFLLHTAEGHQALDYLFKRGLTLDFIQHFQLGLAPKIPGLFRQVMYSKFIKNETLLEAGLLTQKENNKRDFFYDRILFPIRDGLGSIIGFSGRKYKEDTFGGKYVNTPETVLFKKSRLLFGLNYVRRRIAKERQAIIVEGQIDALSLIYRGFNITVAGQGTAFGEGHAKELMNLGVQKVYLALDHDEAGREATKKIGHLFQKEGIEIRVINLPINKDPDSFLQEQGSEAFLKLMEESQDYLTFLVAHEAKRINHDSPSGKNELVQLIAKQIREWNHEVMRYESLRQLAHLTQVPESLILNDQTGQPSLYIRKVGTAGLPTIDPDRILETDFLRLLLARAEIEPATFEIALLNIQPTLFRTAVCQAFYQVCMEERKKQVAEGTSNQPYAKDLLSVLMLVDHADCQLLIDEIIQKKVSKERQEAQFYETIQKLLDRHWMQQREEVKMKIQSGQASDEEVSNLVKEFDRLRANPPKVKKSL